ncbi:basic salivary proline-rich protein 2-like [Equus quagga]|uniref:basic salivary proline-rich protein 2-like n=1 Tax=Equus quagga TaxID=89248 RepID=UPI001EE16247|nr:basic salivary proline-rich protein 2-like [Equus quagga]
MPPRAKSRTEAQPPAPGGGAARRRPVTTAGRDPTRTATDTRAPEQGAAGDGPPPARNVAVARAAAADTEEAAAAPGSESRSGRGPGRAARTGDDGEGLGRRPAAARTEAPGPPAPGVVPRHPERRLAPSPRAQLTGARPRHPPPRPGLSRTWRQRPTPGAWHAGPTRLEPRALRPGPPPASVARGDTRAARPISVPAGGRRGQASAWAGEHRGQWGARRAPRRMERGLAGRLPGTASGADGPPGEHTRDPTANNTRGQSHDAWDAGWPQPPFGLPRAQPHRRGLREAPPPPGAAPSTQPPVCLSGLLRGPRPEGTRSRAAAAPTHARTPPPAAARERAESQPLAAGRSPDRAGPSPRPSARRENHAHTRGPAPDDGPAGRDPPPTRRGEAPAAVGKERLCPRATVVASVATTRRGGAAAGGVRYPKAPSRIAREGFLTEGVSPPPIVRHRAHQGAYRHHGHTTQEGSAVEAVTEGGRHWDRGADQTAPPNQRASAKPLARPATITPTPAWKPQQGEHAGTRPSLPAPTRHAVGGDEAPVPPEGDGHASLTDSTPRSSDTPAQRSPEEADGNRERHRHSASGA